MNSALILSRWLGLALLASLLAGCAGTKIDWASRVGVYTHDQAVLELGPPDKAATLSDGTRVEEWLTDPGRSGAYVTPAYGYGYGYGYGYRSYPYAAVGLYGPAYYAPATPGRWLRLTFAPDGRLQAWQRVTR